jgi:hypothetical protein
MPLDCAGDLLAAAVSTLRAALERQDARTRPAPMTWSPLEYACHVRDTCDAFREHVGLVLSHDDPAFANRHKDVTALERRYADQGPQVVAAELDVALSGLSRQLAATWRCGIFPSPCALNPFMCPRRPPETAHGRGIGDL